MHRKQCTLIHRYVYFLQGVQGLLKILHLYNRDISFDLTKTKALFMASICKVAFNIDGLTIHSTLNIPI
jgi:predicted transcriptional regulator